MFVCDLSVLHAIAGTDVSSLNLPASLNIPSNVGSSLTSAAGTINGVLTSGADATDAIQQYGVDELNKFEATYKRPSTKVCTCCRTYDHASLCRPCLNIAMVINLLKLYILVPVFWCLSMLYCICSTVLTRSAFRR